MRWPKTIELDLPHDDVPMFEVRDFERLPYALVCAEGGWVALDREYRLVGGEWRPEDGELQFATDPRQVPGLFTLIVGNTGWLYNSQFDSSAEYRDRLERLWALTQGCEGRC